MFKFTEAISFVVNCETQEEVDFYWSRLSAGGEESRCGWLKNKFRFVLASRSPRLNRSAGGQGRGKGEAGHARDAPDGQDRDSSAPESVRRKTGERDSLDR